MPYVTLKRLTALNSPIRAHFQKMPSNLQTE